LFWVEKTPEFLGCAFIKKFEVNGQKTPLLRKLGKMHQGTTEKRKVMELRIWNNRVETYKKVT